MNQQSARKLIEDTFCRAFDESRFRQFIRSLLIYLDEPSETPWRPFSNPARDPGHLEKYKRLGLYTDPLGASMEILLISLNGAVGLDRGAERNALRPLLQSPTDAAIAAYFTANRPDWRFSLVRWEAPANRPGGRLSDGYLRRVSFLAGPHEPIHVMQQQLAPFFQTGRERITLQQLATAFDTEPIRRSFLATDKSLRRGRINRRDRTAANRDRQTTSARNPVEKILQTYFLQKSNRAPREARDKTLDPNVGDEQMDPIPKIVARTNVTLREDIPQDKEIAVTPEMLSRLFENQLADNRRKATGTFYTPPEIGHFMVREGLINYLTAQMAHRSIPRRDIDRLIRGRAERLPASKINQAGRFDPLPAGLDRHAHHLDEALASIRIFDPAIGAGAFPVACLHEIAAARINLAPYLPANQRQSPAEFKRHALEHSIYGIEIDPAALETARQRLRLSLLAEEPVEEQSGCANLADNLACGNALLSEFSQPPAGFDLVIGNPPYVRVDEIERDIKADLKARYHSARGKYDLYYLFFERALQIMADRGHCIFITPNKYCAATSAKHLRALLLDSISFAEIISTSTLKIFGSRHNYPIISIYGKSPHRQGLTVREASSLDRLDLAHPRRTYVLTKKAHKRLPDQIIPINVGQAELELGLKLLASCTKLGRYLTFSEGLRIPKGLERRARSDHAIVKQYQIARYGSISAGSYISEGDFRTVSKPTTRRCRAIFKPKILIAEDALRLSATIDFENRIPQGGLYFATNGSTEEPLIFLLGLLNSKLLSTLYQWLYGGMHMGGGYLRYRSRFLENLPLPESVMGSPERQRPVIELVEKILGLARGEKRQTPEKVTQIEASERRLDRLIYDLYDLSSTEIELVEKNKSMATPV